MLRIKLFSPDLKWMQDGALYNNHLFIATGYSNFYVYDWNNKIRLGGPFIWGNGDKLHCNSISFGLKSKQADAFPVLYCSVGGKDRGTCYVYSMSDSYITEKIQTIHIDFISEYIWRGVKVSSVKGRDANGYFVVDSENKYLYVVITRPTGLYTASGRVFKFVLPDLSKKSVILRRNDILDYFDFPFYPVLQGLHINQGILYIATGLHKYVKNQYYLVALDLTKKRQLWACDMSDISKEMEGVWTDSCNRIFFNCYDANSITQIYSLMPGNTATKELDTIISD